MGLPLCAERRFRDSFEDLAFLVWVADLSGQPESGVVVIKRFAIPARSAMYVGNPAKCDQLLGQVPDLLGDQPRLLVMNKRLVVACRALVNGTNVIEHVGLIRQVADVTVYGECPPTGSKPFGVAALVMVDAANVLVQDRLVLRSAYLTEYQQGLPVGVERVPMVAVVQVYPSQVVECLRFPAPVADVTVE
jgi:hypothetical protein